MIEFGDNLNWKWVGELDVAEFTINVDGFTVFCRVSRECLEDHCGDPKTAEEFLDAAKGNFGAITDRVHDLIAGGRYEPDGSILVRTTDW